MSVAAAQRFKRDHRCPICGGADGDPRGASKRCSGFMSSDGKYAHCSREEHAGTLAAEDGGTFAHRLAGPCKCGSTHGEPVEDSPKSWNVEAEYLYYDETGALLYKVIRYEGKVFRQRLANGDWKLGDVRRVLYRLDEVLEADPAHTIYIAEGEKDVDALRRIGLTATTNAQGAGKWHTVVECASMALRDRNVVVIADADPKGRDHAADVAARLGGVARTVRVIELPDAKDAYEWIAKGGTVEQLEKIGPSRGNEQGPREPAKNKWQIESGSAEWISMALPPREHLLIDVRTGRGAIDKTGVWLLSGSGGAGKSYLTIGLCLAVVSGEDWLGSFQVARPGRVLIIAAEDSCEDIRRRVHAIAASSGSTSIAIERFHVLPIHDRVTSLVAKVGDAYAASEDTKSLCAELARGDGYDLVIVDPYGRIAGVSIDADNAAAAATISALAMIATAARGLALGIGHTSLRARVAARSGAPEGTTGIRGATGQGDYARGVLRLEETGGAIWLSVTKANHVAQWESIALKREERGELVPLSAAEVEGLARVNSTDDKQAKKQAAAAERDKLDDASARTALANHPAASVRDLVAIVRGDRHCGSDRAHAAVSRARYE